MPEAFNKSVIGDRFSITPIYRHVIEREETTAFVKAIGEGLTPFEIRNIIKALIRIAYYIEPVKQPKIDSTKYSIRWAESLVNDPRFASFDICQQIYSKLLNEFIEAIKIPANVELLQLILHNTMNPHEINVDYVERLDSNIHDPDNISFFWTEEVKITYLLRKYLAGLSKEEYKTFFTKVYEKICVKAFLTDRVLTGAHKTNREKRWECHPNSVHFALRKECLKIEQKLIEQICHFQDLPDDLKALLQDEHVLEFSEDVTKCPITLEPLLFADLQEEILNPDHGKASFQVGHIHPLKAGANVVSGHTAVNISWISSVGNRIQGEQSVEETQALMKRIFKNYQTANLLN